MSGLVLHEKKNKLLPWFKKYYFKGFFSLFETLLILEQHEVYNKIQRKIQRLPIYTQP